MGIHTGDELIGRIYWVRTGLNSNVLPWSRESRRRPGGCWNPSCRVCPSVLSRLGVSAHWTPGNTENATLGSIQCSSSREVMVGGETWVERGCSGCSGCFCTLTTLQIQKRQVLLSSLIQHSRSQGAVAFWEMAWQKRGGCEAHCVSAHWTPTNTETATLIQSSSVPGVVLGRGGRNTEGVVRKVFLKQRLSSKFSRGGGVWEKGQKSGRVLRMILHTEHKHDNFFFSWFVCGSRSPLCTSTSRTKAFCHWLIHVVM